METHTRNLCNEFNPSKCTHTVVNTHTVNTHPEQWTANAEAPGEQLGVRCLPQGSHLSRGIEGQSSHVKSSFFVIPLYVGTYGETKCRASQDHGATYIQA